MAAPKPFPLQQKMAELETIETYFQGQTPDLEEAIKKQQQALVVAKEILAYLEEAESVIEKLSLTEKQADALQD